MLGLKLSSLENTIISKQTNQSLHSFLKYAEFFYETIIYLAVGLFIGDEFQHKQISLLDTLYLVIFFVLMIVARFLSIGLFYPILKKLGYGINVK